MKRTLEFVTYDTGYMAATNQREYEGGAKYDNIRVVMLGHTGVKTIVVWADSPYQTIADLKGARLATASGTSATHLTQLLMGLGVWRFRKMLQRWDMEKWLKQSKTERSML